MITGHSTYAKVTEARDAGINEFVTKPIAAASLLKRLENVVLRPRPFIRCSGYFGPCRRRKDSATDAGPFRRQGDGLI